MNDDLLALKNFTGQGRLFPLPNLVLFPFAVQGLHIFEPRYRQMTADALAGDRLIAMALLRPGWEADYEGRPPLHPVVCLGRIISEQRLIDGRYNLHVRGLSRARILQEVPGPTPYRVARLQLLAEAGISSPALEERLRAKLRSVVPPWCPDKEPAASVFQSLLNGDVALGILCDILSYALPLGTETKQQILETTDVKERVEAFLDYLQSHSAEPLSNPAAKFKFPPDFSLN